MPADEPGWWYRHEPSLVGRILKPVALLWGREAVRRYRRGRHHKAGIPVICIGNFTAGGTGKTPLALLVASELHRLGANPAFLSRGHGGRARGPHWVGVGRDTAADVGDEPLLLAQAAPTMIARDRAEGAKAIEAAGARHGAIIMDDGLQNGGLDKDLTLAVVDGRRGIGNGLVIPAGPLRAPIDFQIGLVDAIVVNSPAGAAAMADGFVGSLREHFAGPVLAGETRPAGDTGWIAGAQVSAFSGIGAPERFFGLLEGLGARIAVRRVFPDHHVYSASEARDLMAEARDKSLTLVTTEKDWVRLVAGGEQGALKRETRVLAIQLAMAERDALRLTSLLEASLARLRPA